MKVFIIGLALALAGCGVNSGTLASGGAAVADGAGVPAPATVATRTVLDEKVVIAWEKAYTLAAKAASIGIRSGVISNVSVIRKIGELDNKAYLAVTILRSAYLTGNATSYTSALAETQAAITAINELL